MAGTHHLVLQDVKLVLVEGIAIESSELEKGDRRNAMELECNVMVGYPDVPKDIPLEMDQRTAGAWTGAPKERLRNSEARGRTPGKTPVPSLIVFRLKLSQSAP